jgi:hypothetical protein
MYIRPRGLAGIAYTGDDDDIAVSEQYGFSDDGITDGAEGLGLAQAAALKRKLGRNRRRLRVGRQPWGLGAVAVNTPVGGVKFSLKTPSEKRARKVIPGVVASANSGNLTAVAVMDNRRRIGGAGIAKERAEWEKGFSQVSAPVKASYIPVAGRLLASIPSGYKGPEEAAQYALANPQGVPQQSVTVTPSVGPAIPAQSPSDATGAPLPSQIYQSPSQSPVASGGGGVTASEQTAAAAQPYAEADVQGPQQMSMLGMNFDPKILIFGTIAVMVLPKLLGGKSRRRRR